ncbi:hypothetical protein N9Z27_02125 [Alphaproteobacteria bacterium]|nr:hypothetical protein [Alphaproteobacteria bacterium]
MDSKKKTDLSRVEHTFGKISHEINAEFPDLDIIWIAHLPGNRKAAMQKSLHKIYDHPAGEEIIPYLEEISELEDPQYRISSISIERSKSLFGSNRALACSFADFNTLETEQAVRETAYADLFQILELLKGPEFSLKKLKKKYGKTIKPLKSIKEQILLNLGADCFSTICLALEGYKNPLPKMAKARAAQTMEARANHRPELFTFPIMLDMAKILYKNQKNKLENRKNPEKTLFKSVFPIAKDLQSGLDFTAAKSWADFCANTQILAWSSIEPKKILGSAVYTCEDPFMRSDAYLTSEILNIEPALMTDFDFYNPFADNELNERRHKKNCLEIFEVATNKFETESPEDVLHSTATEQNKRFFEGEILGWAAPAFLKLKQDYIQSDAPKEVLESLEETFKKYIDEIPWNTIETAGKNLIQARRKGRTMDTKTAEKLLSPNKEMAQLIKFLIQE